MIKYILTGGNDRAIDSFPAILKQELPDNIPELEMLSCFFAVSSDIWPEKAESWRKWFAEYLGINNYDWADYDNFIDKLIDADIVYFHGGNTKQLLNAVLKYPNIDTYFKNKIIIGSSAGANMLAKNFWSSTFAEYGKGLGLVDANIMVHYGANELEEGSIVRSPEDWEDYYSTFQRIIGDNEKIIPLPEGNIIIFENK